MHLGPLRSAGLVSTAGLALVDAPGGLHLPEAAAQSEASCRVVQLEMTPTPDLQIVAWVEDREGNYIDTAFITRTTGSYGLGNRPGIMDFDSGPLWPYGRRTSTFPVWAGRHGMTWPLVLFQDNMDRQLSHPLSFSSRERFYCRPIKPDEELWDATSCASTVYTDKGVLSEDETSPYPPRSDISFDPSKDHPSVEDMAQLNPFDSVSQATPLGDGPFAATWAVPADLPVGDYVLWLEVSREFDQNDTYAYPSPQVAWSEYGEPYRGQPSVLYRVEFSMQDGRTEATTLDYVGYGDPDGIDAEIRPPDDTITADVPGSGTSRLLVTVNGEQMFRVRVSAFGSEDRNQPDGPGDIEVTDIAPTEVSARFSAPGDDGLEGTVAGYEVRYLASRRDRRGQLRRGRRSRTFEAKVVGSGEEQELVVSELLPRTNYSIGVRAFDECGNVGPVETFDFTTPRPRAGEVDACFVATAAYGSLLAGEVSALRLFRDVMLRTHVPGELAVEGYYTFGPHAGAGHRAVGDAAARGARGAGSGGRGGARPRLLIGCQSEPAVTATSPDSSASTDSGCFSLQVRSSGTVAASSSA